MRLISLFLAIGCFTACTDVHRTERLDKLDELSVKLEEEASKPFDELALSIDSALEQSNKLFESFMSNYSEDTIALNLALQIDEFKKLTNELSVEKEELKFIQMEVSSRIGNVESLRKDIKNDAGNRSKYDDNIMFEINQVTALFDRALETRTLIQNGLEIFKEMYPELLIACNAITKDNAE